jgi:type IV secretion system protein TrbC
MANIRSSAYSSQSNLRGKQQMTVNRSITSGLASRLATLFAFALAFSLRANAAAGGGLPWEAPMTAIATSLTGPVAYAIGLIGIAIAGGAMLWGGELTEFGRRACMIGLVVSVLVFAAPLLASAFGVNAAVV